MKCFRGLWVCTTLLLALALGAFPLRSNAACVGDCDGSGDVTVNELITMVNIALGSAPLSGCAAGDADSSGDITIDEIIAAVNNALGVCPLLPATPTPSPTTTPATFSQIQSAIFNVTCLDIGCHNADDRGGGLVLGPSVAYDNLVGVAPVTFAAAQAGMLRVDPGNPTNSFLLTKLTLPTDFDPLLGSRMPLGKALLTAEQIQLISDWISQGTLRR